MKINNKQLQKLNWLANEEQFELKDKNMPSVQTIQFKYLFNIYAVAQVKKNKDNISYTEK